MKQDSMPYKSLAQEKYFHANKAKLEAQGVDVNEWDKSSKGKKLAKKVSNYHKTKGQSLISKVTGGRM